LIREIHELVKRSLQAKDLFELCPQLAASEADKVQLWVLYDFLVDKYPSMRARDTLRRITNRRALTVGNGFSLRTAVQSAHLAAKNQAPAAL
jgi:hypothetical protein